MATQTDIAGRPRRPWPLGARGLLLVAILAAGLWAAAALELAPGDLVPAASGLETAREFFSRALSPALRSEAPPPWGGYSLLPLALEAAWTTVLFAAGAIGLALAAGAPLGFLGSTAWWAGDPEGGRGRLARFARRTVAPAVYGATRVVISLMRSVHEVLWAVIFNCIWPDVNAFAATVAIAIPYAGTFAKLFSEIIDEMPRDAAHALRDAGATPASVFAFGLLPRAFPEITAYTLYRFECALRSAAVLGWFGIPTLGEKISASFENLYYGEVWTYLYALLALILVVEAWSAAIRRRLV